MLLAMAQDVRGILVKLADRLHNMHTMGAMPAEKRRRIATETQDFYAPIANRLGLHSVYQELEDLGFRYSHPNRYQVLAKAVKAARGNRRELVDKVKIALQEKHEQCKIEATITGREKHLYSIYSEVQTRTHRWWQALLDIQADHGDSPEFLEHIKVDLFPDEVYVFTPKGMIMALPRGATAVDFAFAVHTDVGRHCIAVKINSELMPMRTQLRDGDHVEILTAANASPNAAWLNFVVTGKARSHIRNNLRNTRVEEAAALGERLLNNAIAALNPEAVAPAPTDWERVVKDYGLQNRQELFVCIGLSRKLQLVVAHQFLHVQGENTGEPAHPHAISIRGTEGIAVELAQCCHPIPGDPILGFIHKERGLIIHTHDCPSIRAFRTDPDKSQDVEWEAEPGHMFDVSF